MLYSGVRSAIVASLMHSRRVPNVKTRLQSEVESGQSEVESGDSREVMNTYSATIFHSGFSSRCSRVNIVLSYKGRT